MLRFARVAVSRVAVAAPARLYSAASAPTTLYTAHAVSTGGRGGTSKAGNVDLALSVPKELGGPGGNGTNPEELFAMGYSACFIGAMGVAARTLNLNLPPNVSINSTVSLVRTGGDLNIASTLKVHIPNVDKKKAEEIVQLAHTICPYSRAIKNNVDVTLEVI